MDRISLTRISPLALVVLASGALLLGARSAEATQALEGTWRVRVTVVNCATGKPLGMPFPSLLSFAQGGTLTETTANGSFFPAVRGPGHGSWKATGGKSYDAATEAFITLNGALVRTQRIAQEIVIGDSPDDFFSSASITFYSPAGALLGKGCATAEGERFE